MPLWLDLVAQESGDNPIAISARARRRSSPILATAGFANYEIEVLEYYGTLLPPRNQLDTGAAGKTV
jgi:hypothetical protein